MHNFRHVFGNHTRCRDDSFCTKKYADPPEVDHTPELDAANIFVDIFKSLDPLVQKADRLTANMTNNQAERYNALVAKFVGGKRVDFSKRGGYEGRCVGAGLAHTGGPGWHASPWKRHTGRSPGAVAAKEFVRRKRRHANQVRRALEAGPSKRRKTKAGAPADHDYGTMAAQEDMGEAELETKKQDILETLRQEVATTELQKQLQKDTQVLQYVIASELD